MTKILLIGAALCFLYFISVFFSTQSFFGGIWLVLAIILAILAYCRQSDGIQEIIAKLPLWLRVSAKVTLLAAAAVFVITEGFIVSRMFQTYEASLDYLVVLGAQVKGETVSRVLAERLDQAAAYLNEHEGTIVIVSGGKGEGELITEAEAMYRYLVDKGVDKDRIYKEIWSTNTEENIRNSAMLISDLDASVGLVTSNFHLYRSEQLAKKAGLTNVHGIAAQSSIGLLPNYLLREFLAVTKSRFMGEI